MVVDYRELNKVTVRKFFLIPNSDYIKSTVAGNEYISVGDLKEGFNQVDNEPETRKKMAVLSAGGCWLPRGLTFGPTNGPEDFQELVFTVFCRRLYRDWYLFIDDLSIATGRAKCHPEAQPSGAHDVVTTVLSVDDDPRRRAPLKGFDSTLGYPGEGPPCGAELVVVVCETRHVEDRVGNRFGSVDCDGDNKKLTRSY